MASPEEKQSPNSCDTHLCRCVCVCVVMGGGGKLCLSIGGGDGLIYVGESLGACALMHTTTHTHTHRPNAPPHHTHPSGTMHTHAKGPCSQFGGLGGGMACVCMCVG